MPFYAVAKGRNPGIYYNWSQCRAQTDGFSGALFKKFENYDMAQDFIDENSSQYASSSSESDDDYAQSRTFRKGRNIFSEDENGNVEVYTDGACTGNGRAYAKAGIGIWFSDNNSFNVSRPLDGKATNNRAEITAVTVAAIQARKAGFRRIKILTDSQFVISCINDWMPKWKRNHWTTCSGRPVVNKIELIEMENALAPMQYIICHVPSHEGIYGNERADDFARAGSERYVP